MISLKDLAKQRGVDASGLRKKCVRLKIPMVTAITHHSRGQKCLHVSDTDADRLADEESFSESVIQEESGVFYIVQPEPGQMPERIKFGYASVMADRLRTYHTIAPNATAIKTWKCKRKWEQTIIDMAIGSGLCQLVAGEVYSAEQVKAVVDRVDMLFSFFVKND
jgi:hypothetical protein